MISSKPGGRGLKTQEEISLQKTATGGGMPTGENAVGTKRRNAQRGLSHVHNDISLLEEQLGLEVRGDGERVQTFKH